MRSSIAGRVPVGALVWAVAVAAALAIAAVLARQSGLVDRLFVYFPERELASTPADYGVAFEDVWIDSSDGVRLHGWLVSAVSSSSVSSGAALGHPGRAMLWLHGNAGNIGDRAEAVAAMVRATGATVLIIDYRGYGRSGGSPDEEGLYQDAEAAFDYLVARRKSHGESVAVYGRSLGAAVAVELATRRDVGALILEAPFTSIAAMVRRTYRFLPAGLVVRARFDSLAKMPSVRSPVMVLHGTRDEIVPSDMGRQIYQASPNDKGDKRLFLMKGGSHNDPHTDPAAPYFTALREFLEEVEPGGG